MYLKPQNIPGLSKLAFDYQTDFSKVSSFFAADFRDWNEYKNLAGEVKKIKRDHLPYFTEILTDQNRNFGAGEKTFENIEKLKKKETLVVATGQQVGLFTGPLYTIYKALTTIKLAEKLSSNLNTNVVPVFYIVSEDHDFAEVQWAGFINKSNSYQSLKYDHQSVKERSTVAEIVIDEKINTVFSELVEFFPNTDFSNKTMDLIKSYYQKGVGFHIAFSRLFQHLFKKYGIVIFDSSDPRAKTIVQPVFERELKEQITVNAIQKTNEQLLKKGYHVQIPILEKRPSLFVLENGRHSLEGDGTEYVNKHSNQKILVDELIDSPQKLSPKAPLRPIVEDTLFPTIAYVGGPGEISYWAQLKSVYAEFRLPMPIVFPRAAFSLIEPKIKRLLKKFEKSAEQFIAHKEDIIDSLTKELMPEELTNQLESLRKTINEKFTPIGEKVEAIDPTLQNVHSKALQNIKNQLNMLEQKTLKALQNKEKIVGDQLKTISANLLPDNTLQERKLNILNLLIKYDFSIIDFLYEQISLDKPGHKIVEL